jgi:tetratricopeptide (TPR) repeat protein
MALAAYVAQLLPNSPELVLSAAQCLAADPLDKPALNATLAKLQSLVDQAPYSEAERDYYQAALWASRGEPLRALPELARAVELCPDRTSWRYQLALLLRQAGRIPEAREQMKLCMRAEPTNSRYEQLLRELIRAEITQGKDRTKGA